MKVKMVRRPRSAGFDGKPFPAVGKVVDIPEDRAKALVHYKYAEPVKAEPKAEKPDEKREKAESPAAAQRETREAPARRGPGRPRKSED